MVMVITVFTSSVEAAGSIPVTPVTGRPSEVAAAMMAEAFRLLAAVAAAAPVETFATAKERVYSAL